MSVHNFKKYKESLILLPDIDIMLKIMTLIESTLVHYSHYAPAEKVLTTARDQKKILENYRQELQYVKKNKGIKIDT